MKLETDPATRQRFRDCIDAISCVEFATPPGDPTPQSYYTARLGAAGPVRDQALDKYLRYYLDLFEFVGRSPQGLLVLEVGSGFGLGLVAVAALGAEEAHGVEIVPWQVDFVLAARETMPPELAGRIRPVVGTATSLPYDAETFDVVLSLEAVSHYLDYQPFLDEAHRVLRRGGVLIISDGNNGLNPLIRRKTVKLWASHEAETPAADHHPPDWPWFLVPKREQIIAEADPGLAPEVVHDLALRTSGMIRPQIEDAVRAYAATGTLPDSRYRPGTLTVHPDQEMVMERLFNPFSLGRELTARGFDVRVKGHWGGAGGSRLVRVVNGVLRWASPVTMRAARAFRIRAVRR